MTAKKAVRRSVQAAQLPGKTDESLVQEAYADAVKNQVQVFIANTIDQTPDSEKKFLAGLSIIRRVRNRALELVKE